VLESMWICGMILPFYILLPRLLLLLLISGVSFCQKCSSLSLQRLRGRAGGGGLGSGLDGGRPFFLFFCVFFFFSSVLLCFCFLLLFLTVLLPTGRTVSAGGDDDGSVTVALLCGGFRG